MFVLPFMDYCDEVWILSSAMHFKRLEKIHSIFFQFEIYCLQFSDYYSNRAVVLSNMHRALKKIAPSYLHDTFKYAVDITGRVTLNTHRLFAPRVRTLAKNSFYFHGTRIWNSLNPMLYGAKKLASF